MFAQNETPAPAEKSSSEDFGARRSLVIPALEILGFDFLVNRVNNRFDHTGAYRVTAETVRRNLRGGWVTDNDPFNVNQFGHPYQGSMYHGFARSAGLNYWQASAYTFAGSAAWEIAGESTRPSLNDQVASGIAGSFLGEALFRMASLVLENGDGVPNVWREVLAATISPSTGFNRLAFGDRFAPIFASHGAPYYSRLQLGVSGTVHQKAASTADLKRTEGLADFSMLYGLPGKDGYAYTRPFDYFAFEATATTANTFENIATRGMLVGRAYGGREDSYRGIWGLFGSYDYIAPQAYRISSTALSIGTRLQWWLAESVALQGSALLGVGYSAVGALRGRTENDYTYGATPQGLLSARVIFGDRVSVDATGREFFVSGVGSGTDNIARGEVAFTWRLVRRHGIALRYLWNRRDASSEVLGSRTQIRSTLGLFYVLLGRDAFESVDWR